LIQLIQSTEFEVNAYFSVKLLPQISKFNFDFEGFSNEALLTMRSPQTATALVYTSIFHGSLVLLCGRHPLPIILSLLKKSISFEDVAIVEHVLDIIALSFGYNGRSDLIQPFMEKLLNEWIDINSFPFSTAGSYKSIQEFIDINVGILVAKYVRERKWNLIGELCKRVSEKDLLALAFPNAYVCYLLNGHTVFE
jgi:hypothetical protein